MLRVAECFQRRAGRPHADGLEIGLASPQTFQRFQLLESLQEPPMSVGVLNHESGLVRDRQREKCLGFFGSLQRRRRITLEGGRTLEDLVE